MDNLTKDAKKLLCELYRVYLERRKSNLSREDSNNFPSCKSIHEEIVPNWIFADIEDTCRELSRGNFINCLWYDNSAFNISLTTSAISILENRFKDSIKSVISFLATLL